MDRLISEKAVIDRLSHWYSDMLETGKEQEDLIEVIKAIPSAEPCEDAISREEAKQFLYERIDRLNDDELYDIFSRIIDDMYNDLPSIKSQEPKWIPVSERLPKTAGIYRVTRYYPNNVMNPNYLVDACCFDGSNTWYDDNRINYDRAYADNIIAWQENPEPYKAESEDKE